MGSLGARRLTASLRSAPSSLRNSTSTDSEYSSWNSLMSLTAPQYQRPQTAARRQHRRLIGKAGEPTSMVSKWHGNGKVRLQLEQLQLGGAGEIATAVGADDHEVLDPDGSHAGRQGAGPLLVDRLAGGPVPHELDAAELGGQDGVVHPPEIVRRFPLDHGPRHICEVAGAAPPRGDGEDGGAG